jgi:hypothetical protein
VHKGEGLIRFAFVVCLLLSFMIRTPKVANPTKLLAPASSCAGIRRSPVLLEGDEDRGAVRSSPEGSSSCGSSREDFKTNVVLARVSGLLHLNLFQLVPRINEKGDLK